MERATSKTFKDKAVQNPREWMFIAQDGSDQLPYGLPNFWELGKEQPRRIRIHLTISYVAGDNVYIYTHTIRLMMD